MIFRLEFLAKTIIISCFPAEKVFFYLLFAISNHAKNLLENNFI